MTYKTRAVVFLDILGFRNIILDSSKQGSNYDVNTLSDIFNIISEVFNLNEEYWEVRKTKQATHFSDCIVVSYEIKDIAEIIGVIVDVQHLISELINYKILVRGSITIGDLVHNRKMLFGPALVQAYEMERKAAHYPRIILEESLLGDLKLKNISKAIASKVEFKLLDLVQKDQDGFYFIDYFFNLGFIRIVRQYKKNVSEKIFSEYLSYLKKLKELIEIGLRERDPGVKAKYQWMKQKFNLTNKSFRKEERASIIKKSVQKNEFDEIMKLKSIKG